MKMTTAQRNYLDNLDESQPDADAVSHLMRHFSMSEKDALAVLAEWHSYHHSTKLMDEDDDSSSILGDVATGFILGELLSDSSPSSPSFDIDSSPSFNSDPTPDFGGGGGFGGGGAGGDF